MSFACLQVGHFLRLVREGSERVPERSRRQRVTWALLCRYWLPIAATGANNDNTVACFDITRDLCCGRARLRPGKSPGKYAVAAARGAIGPVQFVACSRSRCTNRHAVIWRDPEYPAPCRLRTDKEPGRDHGRRLHSATRCAARGHQAVIATGAARAMARQAAPRVAAAPATSSRVVARPSESRTAPSA